VPLSFDNLSARMLHSWQAEFVNFPFQRGTQLEREVVQLF